jgi:Transposase IS116/IS110/IS902 family
VDERIRQYDLRVALVLGQDERCQRLAKVEGVGPPITTALVAAVGNAHEFKRGANERVAGLVPRQHPSGGKTVLLGISDKLKFRPFGWIRHSAGYCLHQKLAGAAHNLTPEEFAAKRQRSSASAHRWASGGFQPHHSFNHVGLVSTQVWKEPVRLVRHHR